MTMRRVLRVFALASLGMMCASPSARLTPDRAGATVTGQVTINGGAGGPGVVLAPATPTTILRAFPGAQGWAAGTPAGRGGRIIRVTTLSGWGSGSLAQALTADGPRIVVFEVGGVIDLQARKIDVRSPFLTVAGQTAPSPGITIIRGGITVETHDVVIRHIRVRPGEAGASKSSGWEIDALSTGTGAHDVIVDHCSTSWATDENLSASGKRFGGGDPQGWREATSHRITFSNCIVAEGLSESTHTKGEHSKGSLIHDNATAIAIIGNLYFSNVDRNPLFKGGARGIVVNNYIHNPGKTAIKYNLLANEWEDNPYQTGQIAVVGNVFTYGPNTPLGVPLVFVAGQGPCEIYLDDNITRDHRGAGVPLLGGTPANIVPIPRRPFWPAGYTPLAASGVREHVAKDVGARPWDRDAIDTRIVQQALAGGGKIIDSEEDVGGYPSSPETRMPFKADEWDLASMTRRSGADH